MDQDGLWFGAGSDGIGVVLFAHFLYTIIGCLILFRFDSCIFLVCLVDGSSTLSLVLFCLPLSLVYPMRTFSGNIIVCRSQCSNK